MLETDRKMAGAESRDMASARIRAPAAQSGAAPGLPVGEGAPIVEATASSGTGCSTSILQFNPWFDTRGDAGQSRTGRGGRETDAGRAAILRVFGIRSIADI